jgi:hypothetical protein
VAKRSIRSGGRSAQKKHHGGKFHSERQRRMMWARFPRAAKKWAHNLKTRKTDWVTAKPKRPGTGSLKPGKRSRRGRPDAK